MTPRDYTLDELMAAWMALEERADTGTDEMRALFERAWDAAIAAAMTPEDREPEEGCAIGATVPLASRCPCGEDCEIVDYPTGVRSCGNVWP